MKRSFLLSIAVFGAMTLAWGELAQAWERGRIAYRQAMFQPWNAGYYHAAWGMPVALVVPPTAEFQTNWGWGVGNTRVTPIWHQFQREYPGPGHYDARMFRPTPPWPSDTTQFGVYYVRGPW